MTTQERHVFCAWCWRAVPAHGDTYVPRPHHDTLGKPCRGETMCGATTYSVGTPPCERGEPRTFAFAYAVPDAATIEAVLAERSAETEALRAEAARLRRLLAAYHCADDGAWPLIDSMDRLAAAATHLLDDHNCDEEGNEEVRFAIATARQVAAAVRSAMRHGREIDEAATATEASDE